jgi:hypothetical protein
VLCVEIPLGILMALSHAGRLEGIGDAGHHRAVAADSLNVVGTIWQIFGRTDIGLGAALDGLGSTTTTPATRSTPG